MHVSDTLEADVSDMIPGMQAHIQNNGKFFEQFLGQMVLLLQKDQVISDYKLKHC